jgi:hypothetical protein
MLQTGTVILDIFYETTIASRLGGRDPMHVLVLTATIAALHGLLNTESVKRTVGLGGTGEADS